MASKLSGFDLKTPEYMKVVREAVEGMATDKRFTKVDICEALGVPTEGVDSMVIGEYLLKLSSGHRGSVKRGTRVLNWSNGSPRKYNWYEDDED